MNEVREELWQLDKEQLIDIILELREIIARQETGVQALEDQLGSVEMYMGLDILL